jgi:carbonic anhydrase
VSESSENFTPSADELIANNASYAEQFDDRGLAVAPRRRLAIVACMDSRMDIFEMLGLGQGDAHVIRNAGGVVTDDVERSLVISQRLLGTREIILLHHTDCGLQKVVDDELRDQLEAETGLWPSWELHGFKDPAASVRRSMRRLRADPFLVDSDHVRGFVYHVDTGRLVEAFV